MNAADRRFAERIVRRKRLFLALSVAGVAIAVALAGWTAIRRFRDPSFPIATRMVIVVLVLLNARQNLRQYRCARVLEPSIEPGRLP